MKKAFFLVLLVPILTIGLISCDASIRSNIADLMGGFSGNVYVEAGLVEPNKADVQAAVAVVSALGTSSESVSTYTVAQDEDAFGVGITVAVAKNTTILKPQSTADQTTLKNDLAATLNSPTQTATLLTELAKPITDSAQKKVVADTVTVFNATLTALKGQLTGDAELQTAIDKLTLPAVDADNDDLTQGDVLVLQMMTNLVSNTVTKLKAIDDTLSGIDGEDIAANKTQLLGIVDDALFTAQIAEQISGAASIDFSGQLDLASLLDNLNKSSRSSSSRTDGTIDLGDASEFLSTINGIVPDILTLMGITKSESTFDYTDAKYKSFILNQKAYRSAMEHGMTFKRKGGIAKADLVNANLDTSTLIKYGLAVFFTEHEAYVQKKAGGKTGNGLIVSFLNANTALANGTLTETSQLVIPSTIADDGYYDDWPTFLYYGDIKAISPKKRDIPYYKNILNTLIEVNDIGGISELSTELKEFRDNTVTTDEGGLAGWYAGLIL